MVESEWEMLREKREREKKTEERFTSLQPTYEDSVPLPEEWEYDDAE